MVERLKWWSEEEPETTEEAVHMAYDIMDELDIAATNDDIRPFFEKLDNHRIVFPVQYCKQWGATCTLRKQGGGRECPEDLPLLHFHCLRGRMKAAIKMLATMAPRQNREPLKTMQKKFAFILAELFTYINVWIHDIGSKEET